MNTPCSKREKENKRAALWPLSRAESLLWQLSLMFVQAWCHQPVWALYRHKVVMDFCILSVRKHAVRYSALYQEGEGSNSSNSVSPWIMVYSWVILCFFSIVALTYCLLSLQEHSKAVVCRVLSLPHPQRSFVKGLSEARRRAAERKVSKSHSSKTLESHAGSVSLRFFFVCCLFVS